MFRGYDKEIRKVIAEDIKVNNWDSILKRHKLMIKRLQHERLIHLMVTIFVGLVLMMTFLATAVTGEILLGALSIIFLILFTVYIFHYRFLENTVQSWYLLEDKIINNAEK